jgi:hypothetical protein
LSPHFTLEAIHDYHLSYIVTTLEAKLANQSYSVTALETKPINQSITYHYHDLSKTCQSNNLIFVAALEAKAANQSIIHNTGDATL